MKWSDNMKIQMETAHKKEDESLLDDLCKDLLENGIESIIENGMISLKMPLELFMEFGLDAFLGKEIER